MKKRKSGLLAKFGTTTIAKLREDLPKWTWVARRDGLGLGWEYFGRKGGRTVRVHAAAQLVDEDEFTTVWLATEANTTVPLSSFWMGECLPEHALRPCENCGDTLCKDAYYGIPGQPF